MLAKLRNKCLSCVIHMWYMYLHIQIHTYICENHTCKKSSERRFFNSFGKRTTIMSIVKHGDFQGYFYLKFLLCICSNEVVLGQNVWYFCRYWPIDLRKIVKKKNINRWRDICVCVCVTCIQVLQWLQIFTNCKLYISFDLFLSS